MIAIIETGGKQYLVEPGEVIAVEKLTAQAGETINFDKVLLVADQSQVSLGRPYVSGAKVAATVLKTGKGEKIQGLKYKAKSRYRRRYGHRQSFTAVRIETIA